MRFWKITFTLLFLILAAVILAIFQYPDKNLHIIACNVGQGDAILITHGFTQILTDGGPDNTVLDCLGRYLPFWDRKIELVISTHPDADHITGLIYVLQYYKVDKLLINPINPGTSVFQALVSRVGGDGITTINPTMGMRLGIDLIYLDIVNPTDQMFNKLSTINEGDALDKYLLKDGTNYYSIAYLLSFKNFNGIFLGDIPPEVSDQLSVGSVIKQVNYIKIPHHGSINGITENLLKTTMPKIAVISVGDNKWGLPKPEIIELLTKYNIQVLRTDQMGDIEVITDGSNYWVN